MRLIFLVALTAGCFDAMAQDYRCLIREVTGADSTSAFVKANKRLIGKEFTVHRRTGLMAGALKNSYLTEPQVIDPGGKENSFRVVTTLPKSRNTAGSNVYVLVVDEYYESLKKPFVFLENAVIYMGECVHF